MGLYAKAEEKEMTIEEGIIVAVIGTTIGGLLLAGLIAGCKSLFEKYKEWRYVHWYRKQDWTITSI